jgi:hypothetical protein
MKRGFAVTCVTAALILGTPQAAVPKGTGNFEPKAQLDTSQIVKGEYPPFCEKFRYRCD